MNPRTGHPEYLTLAEATNFLEVSQIELLDWIKWLSNYHPVETLLIEGIRIPLEGFAILKEFRGDKERYATNHQLLKKLYTRSQVGRELEITAKAVSKILKEIEKLHSTNNFFEGRKLTQTAVDRVTEYHKLGRDCYMTKYTRSAA